MKPNCVVIVIVLVALLVLLHQSTSTSFCIVPEEVEEEMNSSCVTLNRFAKSDYNLHSEINLVLESGNHSLDTNILVFNSSEFRLVSVQNDITNILCESRVGFIVKNVTNVYFNGLNFMGCGTNAFYAVDNLFMESSTFIAYEENRIALLLNGTISTEIISSIFVTNEHGASSYGDLEQSGSTVVAIMASNVFIQDTVFQNNSGDFPIVYIERVYTIDFRRCHFLGNRGRGVIFATHSIILINESTFYSNVHNNRSRLITTVISSVEIEMTNFTENSEVIVVHVSNIVMKQCNFHYNHVPANTGFVEGRRLDISYGAIVLADISNITVIMCSFIANKATEYGGIIVVNNSTFVSDVRLEIFNNKAMEGAIVVINSEAFFNGNTFIENNVGSLANLESFLYFRGSILLSNNTPSARDNDIIRGGAITAYFGHLEFREANVTIINNRAINGAAFNAVGSFILIYSNMNITGNVAQEFGGGFFLYQTPLYILSNVSITNNEAKSGGGIYASSSYITVTSSQEASFHSLTLTNNVAQHGGGLFFSSGAHVYVYHLDQRPHRMIVVFTSNSADYGGAIFVRDETNVVVCEAGSVETSATSDCFFQVVDLNSDAGKLGLYFEHNTALSEGAEIYGGLLDRCAVTRLVSSSFFDTDLGGALIKLNGESYLKAVSNLRNTDSITSKPVSVCFCFEGKPNCDVEQLQIQTQKGKNNNLSVTAVDHVGHLLEAEIFTEIQSTTGGLGDGQQSQMIDDQCTNLSLSVTSSASEETIVIYAVGPCGNAQRSVRNVTVVFSECACPIGFEVNHLALSTCECICNEEIKDYIQSCDIETLSFIKSNDFWISYENSTNSFGFLIGHICPYDYCLPFDDVEINLNIPDGADSQCANNRAGILCGSCQPQYSLSIGQSVCVKCSNFWPLNTILFALATLITGILLVIVFLFLNLTVTVGTMNGLIFAANILKAVYPFPGRYHGTYLISFLNLDVGLNVCFYEGFNTYIKTWLELILPAYLILIVLIVIYASNYSAKFARFIGKRNPVETLASLLFLSYAKLLQFTIGALSFTVIDHPNNTTELVWLSDGSIGYFEISHIIMIIAAIIIFFIVLIYTFLLLFWQLLVKCPNWKIFAILCRNTKVQAFVEMYHVPFHNSHRYWTGLLLLIRSVVYLVAVSTSTLNTRGEKHITIVSLLTVLLVIKSLKVRVYKKWPVDVLESVLIALTIILTGVSWYELNTKINRITLAMTSTASAIMVCLFAGIIVYHVNEYIIKKRFDVQKQLTGLRHNVSQRFHSAMNSYSNKDSNSQEEEVVDFGYPDNIRYLDVDRFGSILRVMDAPTESDYRLHVQLTSESLATEYNEHEREAEPVQPTFSSLPRIYDS